MTRLVVWGAGTPRTLRVHWMLHELDVPYECRPIGPRTGETQTPEFVALHPGQKVPVLVDGDWVLTESGAIVNYLAEAYGGRMGLAPPREPRDRARYDQACYFALTELDANAYVIRRHTALANVFGEADAAVNAARGVLARQMDVLAQRLRARPYALGDRFSAADVLLVTSLQMIAASAIPLPGALVEYGDRARAREAYVRAVAVR